jgi:hypothetical protein
MPQLQNSEIPKFRAGGTFGGWPLSAVKFITLDAFAPFLSKIEYQKRIRVSKEFSYPCLTPNCCSNVFCFLKIHFTYFPQASLAMS